MLQDGWECWDCKTRKAAIQSMIQFARVGNNSYITEKDIAFMNQESAPIPLIGLEDQKLLEKIKSKHLIPLEFDDPRIKFRITPEECQLIVDIREGTVTTKRKKK